MRSKRRTPKRSRQQWNSVRWPIANAEQHSEERYPFQRIPARKRVRTRCSALQYEKPSMHDSIDRPQDHPAEIIRNISPNDEMLFEKRPILGGPGIAAYFEVGRSAMHAISVSLQSAGKPPESVKRILDLPCGHGRVMRHLKAAFPHAEITACDLLRDGVDFCAKTFGAIPVYSHEDPAKIRLDRDAYDLIWVGSLLTHFDTDFWTAFLRRFRDCLKPGGLLVFSAHGREVHRALVMREKRTLEEPRHKFLHRYQRTGFAYYSDPPGGVYGVSLSSAARVLETTGQFEEFRLVHFGEKQWDDNQDVYAFLFDPDWHVRVPEIDTFEFLTHGAKVAQKRVTDSVGGAWREGVRRLTVCVGNAVRPLRQAVISRPLVGPYLHESEYCYSAPLPELQDLADDADQGRLSPLLLFEDGKQLGPTHSDRRYITSVGRGHFVHAKDRLFFSTPDNSDPNTNGRTYSFTVSPRLYGRSASVPASHRTNRVDPGCLDEAVSSALTGSDAIAGLLVEENAATKDASRRAADPGDFRQLIRGKTVLDLSPGSDYGVAMMLACYGAKPVAVDPFPVRWNAGFHPKFFRMLSEQTTGCEGSCDAGPLQGLIDANSFVDEIIQREQSYVENIGLADESVDVVFSRAAFEHHYDLRAAFEQLYRVTKPGGVGLHWVDFRDHRDFDRPLEYLLLPENEFRHQFGLYRGDIGNRCRPDEVGKILRECGFDFVCFEATRHADERYLQDFVTRLEQAAGSPYRGYAADDLQVLGGFFHLRKPAVGG